MDLSVKIGSVTLQSPVIASSCEDGRNGDRIKKVAGFGPGAITTKTIVPYEQPPHDPLPCMKKLPSGFVNCVLATVVPAKQWYGRDFSVALSGGVPVVANFAGTCVEESAQLAADCEKAGATLLEYPSACPHMGGILEAMYPGMNMPLPEAHDPRVYADHIRQIKKVTKIPLIAKLSAIHFYNIKEWAVAVQEAGADAIAAADTIGPVLCIDPETGMPLLGGPNGFGGLSGAAIKPIVLKMIYEIAEVTDLPIIGIGGVSSGLDAIEYFMAGASAVGVAAKSNLMGPDTYGKIRDEIAAYLDSHGYSSIADIRGLTHKRVAERAAQGRTIIHTPVAPEVDPALCNGCGSCLRSCVYDSITMEDKKPVFHPETCYGCGLCVSVCPKKALSQHYYD